MKSKILLIVLIMIFVSLTSIELTKELYRNNYYQQVGLKINEYDIEYFTTYEGNPLYGEYIVYKFKNYYSDSMEEFKKQLEVSKLWNKKKYYEYIMQEFYEIKDENKVYIDRNNLYYYHGKKKYAIFDLNNAKLYIFLNRNNNHHKDYNKILELEVSDYISREIYSIRGGWQNDGSDYYIYKFSDKQAENIENTISKSKIWNKEKLDNQILESFEHNNEVFDIKNGYYHYKKICRTCEESKNVTDEEATGYEVGVYDIDNNILYYFWESI